MPIANLHDIDIYYESHGRGSPLVLIAGYARDHTFWSGVVPQLAPRFEVVVFDNRGIGKTKDDGTPFAIEDMARDTTALIGHLDLVRPVIVGQSIGGAIVQSMLAHFPSACGPCGMFNSTQILGQRAQMALQSLFSLRQAYVELDLVADASLPWLAGNEWLSRPENVAAFKASLKTDPAPQSVYDQARQLAALQEFDGRPLNRTWTYPALVVSSTDDALAPVGEGALLAQRIGAKFVEIPGGHASPVEEPARLAGLIVEFFRNSPEKR